MFFFINTIKLNISFKTIKYNFSFDNNLEKDDILFDRTIIDKASLEIISGSTVDFKKEMIGESFTINNPKATSSCGCGLSFSA